MLFDKIIFNGIEMEVTEVFYVGGTKILTLDNNVCIIG